MKYKQVIALLLASQLLTTPVLLGADVKPEQTEDGERFVDEGGALALNAKGYAVEKDTKDETGNIISRSYFGVDGNPVTISEGYSVVRYKYDEQNRVIETRYYDTNGQPVLINRGIAGINNTYDE